MITKSQIKIMDAIKRYYCENGYSPTTREIGKLTGLRSSSTVHKHLHKLKEKGFIDMKDNQPRTILLLENDYYEGD